MAEWNKITYKKPEPDQNVLVFARGYFLVSSANFYDERQRAEFAQMATNPPEWMSHLKEEKHKKHYLECEGYFEEFGQKYYFDDPTVFWTTLPETPYV